MPPLALELDLLRAAGRATAAGTDETAALTALLPRVNWHHALWLGRDHELLPALHRTLRAAPLSPLCPPEILAQLADYAAVVQLRAFARAREFFQVQELFAHHALRALPADGWSAAHAIGAAPADEFGSSIRFFVPPDELARAHHLLLDAGHPVTSDPEKLITRGRSPVLLNRGLGAHAAAARFAARATTFTLGGRTFPGLAPEHWVLLRTPFSTDANTLSIGRAARAGRLARRIPADGWAAVFAEAAHFGHEHTLPARLAACHAALALPLPAALAAHFTAPPAIAATAARPASDPPAPPRVPFLATPPAVMSRMLALAAPRPGELVLDLGCGDGRFVVEAAKNFGARGVGVDLDPVRLGEARARAELAGVTAQVAWRCEDIFATDIRDADVLCAYLLPPLHPPLLKKLQREAKPGLRLVSHDYIFPGWPPERTEIIRTGPLKVSQIYLWRMP
ncbi:MAG: hypothetical protein RLZZ15_2101 [Verrucomicrobiota bacterium]|jgi:hypothetical protein